MDIRTFALRVVFLFISPTTHFSLAMPGACANIKINKFHSCISSYRNIGNIVSFSHIYFDQAI